MPSSFIPKRFFLITIMLGLLLFGLLLGGIVSQADSDGSGQTIFLPFMQSGPSGAVVVDDPNTLIIGMPAGSSATWVEMVLSQNFDGQVRDSIPQLDIYQVYFAQGIPAQDVQEQIKAMLGARFVEPNLPVELFETRPNDPKYDEQWAHETIESPKAWDVTQGSSRVVVAIVDTGVDLNHPDLKDRFTPRDTWYDFGEDDDDPSDTYGHGTHVAGIVGATGNNSEGVSGAGWRTSLMPVKVFPDGKGSTSMYTVAKGVVHAVDHNADIINLSLGGSSDSDAMRDAVNYAYDHDVLVVAAAGNDDSDNPSYPAANEHVLAVAATDRQDKKASFSNYGDWVDISAPGVSILSTMPTYHVTMNDKGAKQDYDNLNGTSMASPLVAGVAALVKDVHADWGPDQISQKLRETSDDIDGKNPDYAGKLGDGRVNAGSAVAGENPPTPTPTATAQPTATPTATAQPTATPTPTAPPPNLLPNPSFEFGSWFSGPTGWSSQGAGTAWTQDQSSDGDRSLAIGPCMFGECGYWQSDPVSLDPDHTFQLTGDLMIISDMMPALALEQWDEDGELLGELSLPITQTLPITQPIPASIWQEFDLTLGEATDFLLDPETTAISVRLYIEEGVNGTAWFDDLYLGDLALSKP